MSRKELLVSKLETIIIYKIWDCRLDITYGIIILIPCELSLKEPSTAGERNTRKLLMRYWCGWKQLKVGSSRTSPTLKLRSEVPTKSRPTEWFST